jgi:hypothetical protein
MWIKREDNRRPAQPPRMVHQTGCQSSVSSMDSIEIADRHGAALQLGRDIGN